MVVTMDRRGVLRVATGAVAALGASAVGATQAAPHAVAYAVVLPESIAPSNAEMALAFEETMSRIEGLFSESGLDLDVLDGANGPRLLSNGWHDNSNVYSADGAEHITDCVRVAFSLDREHGSVATFYRGTLRQQYASRLGTDDEDLSHLDATVVHHPSVAIVGGFVVREGKEHP